MKCSLCTGFCATLCLCLGFMGADTLHGLDCREWLESVTIEIPGVDRGEDGAFEDTEEPRTIEPELEDLDEDNEKHNFRETHGEPVF